MVRSGLVGCYMGDLIVGYINGNWWEISNKGGEQQLFGMFVEADGKVVNIHPADGFRFDFASIPVGARVIYRKTGTGDKDGKYGRAACIHDWLYSYPPVWCTRKLADRIFLLGMELDGVRPSLRAFFYAMVRMWGWRYYGKPSKLEEIRNK